MSDDTEAVSIEDLIGAIGNEQAMDAQNAFADLMAGKIADALENEKVRIAGELFNEPSEEDLEEIDSELLEPSEEDLEEIESELLEPSEEGDMETSWFEEPVEEPVAEIDLGSDEEHEEVEDTLGLYGVEEAETDVEEILSSEE